MKMFFIYFTFFFSSLVLSSEPGVQGKVLSVKGCSSPVMVWLSLDKDNYKDRLLLLHTSVPVGGSFQFYLKNGDYQVRASDDKGCEYLKKIQVRNQLVNLEVKMVKK